MNSTPRIRSVQAETPSTLVIAWKAGGTARVDLAGWLAKAGPILAPLKRPEVFARAAVGDHGADVTWDEGEGDLAIDAIHLERLAALQMPFTAEGLKRTQIELGLSNVELASVLGVGKTQFAAYRGGSQEIPASVAIAVRAMEADPTILHAHLRPVGQVGRPRKSAAADKVI